MSTQERVSWLDRRAERHLCWRHFEPRVRVQFVIIWRRPMKGENTRDHTLPPAYSDRLDSLALAPLWTALHTLLPYERRTSVVPHVWHWADIRPPLLEAAQLVPIENAERRVLVLRNPGLGGAYGITSTLFAGLQIILPGEQAPSHHH